MFNVLLPLKQEDNTQNYYYIRILSYYICIIKTITIHFYFHVLFS